MTTNKRTLVLWLLSMAICVGIGTGCSTVPVTGRQQINFVSADEEMKLGLTEFEKMKKETPISRDQNLIQMVERVGNRIAAVARPDLPNAQWEFVVFENKEPNAFCLPGGKVGVHTGIMPIAKNEAGLATVIGHEVAHAAAHHGAERMSQAVLLQSGGEVLGVGMAGADSRAQAVASTLYGLGSQLGIALPHSRKQESEADQIGLIYMARAGYDPQESIAFWERFADFNRRSGGATPWFLRTHPLDETRVQQLKTWLPQAQQEYRTAKGGVAPR
ncbi:MAG TPA: M48 family metallopeptidase [Candidatus Paceibacterota bacterium]|nr:M48 family metallopeptidase [Candidatus Paceibacterota bacterium]